MTTHVIKTDLPTTFLTALGTLFVVLVIQHEISSRQAVLFLIGIALGFSLLHAAFGFAGGWRRWARESRSMGLRAQLLLVAGTSVVFFPVLGQLFEGVRAGGALAPVGVSVGVGALLFGIGMQLGGGCGSGTLFTVGGGHIKMLITLAFFIAGSTLGSAHLGWWLSLPNVGKISLIKELGWGSALVLQLAILAAMYGIAVWLERRRRGDVQSLVTTEDERPFMERLVLGPWPVWWGALALALLGITTLFVAGHPWSITFAFGLWGAKIWGALGGSPELWAYWSSGYPQKALHSSVLTDVTSVMDFGIILGAVLAAALAGKFAPASRIRRNDFVAAVIGGLLLGYGARLAFGCNIGALLGGIASGSVHGWLWLVAGFTGSFIGVRLRIRMGLDKPIVN